ncbi:hypothetical protein H0H93_007138, partial [Arthromyces matolae]
FESRDKQMDQLELTDILHKEPHVTSPRNYPESHLSSELEVSEDEDQLSEKENEPGIYESHDL